MYLLDSNILIYSARSEHAFLRSYISNQSTPAAVSVVTAIEVLGFHRLTPNDKNYCESCFGLLELLEVTASIAEKAVELRQRQKMSLGDAIIAATAITHNLELITRNTSDFAEIAGLRVLNPF